MSEEQQIPGSPMRAVIPPDDDMGIDRPHYPAPGAWQDGVMVRRKSDGHEGQCRRVDLGVRQFRLVGEGRTKWQSCEDWDPIVEKTAEERAREAAKDELAGELAKLTPEQAAVVAVMADDPDPIKALMKLRVLRQIGALTTAESSVIESVETQEPKGQPYRGNARKGT